MAAKKDKKGKKAQQLSSPADVKEVEEMHDDHQPEKKEIGSIISSPPVGDKSDAQEAATTDTRDEPESVIEESKSFDDLGLSTWIVKQCRAMGLNKPTPVQVNCIPGILKGFFLCDAKSLLSCLSSNFSSVTLDKVKIVQPVPRQAAARRLRLPSLSLMSCREILSVSLQLY
jgi:hypothetical protein